MEKWVEILKCIISHSSIKSLVPPLHKFTIQKSDLFSSFCGKLNLLKACVRYFYFYFYLNFYFSPNGSPSKTKKDAFYFIWKALFVQEIFNFLYFHLSFFFSLSAIAWELKVCDVINCQVLSKNLVTHFVWYLQKKKSYDIETLAIDTILNKEHFYGKIIQKMCTRR